MKNDFNVDQIKKLWILDLIIQTGSLKAAAAKAKITPSAISQSLTSLEKKVGKPLIIRSKGHVEATSDALAILEMVRPAFDVFDRLGNLGSQPVPKMTWLNFGTYESIAIDILPGLLHSLREKLPHLRLGLRVARTNQLLTMVRKGELCSAIVTETEELERFYRVKVFEDRLGVYISSRHPINDWMTAAAQMNLGSLAPGKNGLPRYYTRFLKRTGSLNKPSILCESFETLRAATSGGAMISILPHRVAQRSSDLREITPPSLQNGKDSGAHGIFVVSQYNCDPEEADFLAEETRRLLPQMNKK